MSLAKQVASQVANPVARQVVKSAGGGDTIDRLTVDTTLYTTDSSQITADTTLEPEV